MKNLNKLISSLAAIIVLAFSLGCNEDDIIVTPITVNEVSLLSPVDKQVDQATEVNFSWRNLGDGITYNLLVSTNQDLLEPIINENNLSDSLYTASLEGGTNYYWKVVGKNQNDQEVSSKIATFRTVFLEPQPSPEVSKYYVTPDGSDLPESGTSANPFRTLFYASKMVPSEEGDTIFLAAGNYIETESATIPLGVNVIGAGVNATKITAGKLGSGYETDYNLTIYKERYQASLIQLISDVTVEGEGTKSPANGNQVVSGFAIDGSNKELKAGIWVQNRNNITIKDIKVEECAQRGIVVSRGISGNDEERFIKGLEISDITLINNGVDLESETLGNLCLGGLDGASVHDISIEDDEGYGIKFIFRGYFINCEFFNITTQLNEFDEKWTEDAAIELWNFGPGNTVSNVRSNTWHSYINDPNIYITEGAKENLILSNLRIIDQDATNTDRGIEMAVPHSILKDSYVQDKGFAVAIWETARINLTIHNNIFYNTKYQSNFAGGPAIFIANSKEWEFDDIFIYNNVFEKHNYGVRIQGNDVKVVSIRNNLFIDIATKDVENTVFMAFASARNNHKYNSDSNPSNWKFDGISAENNFTGNPEIMGTGERWETYYIPTLGSPLIDSGQDVGFSFLGSAPDIGFFEVQ